VQEQSVENNLTMTEASEYVAHVDEHLARKAMQEFLLRSFMTYRLGSIVGSLIAFLTGAVLAYYYYFNSRVFTVLSIVGFCLVLLFPIAIYLARPWEAAKLASQSPDTRVQFTEKGITHTRGDKVVEYPWGRFCAVWQYDDFLLLVKNAFFFITLPCAGMPAGVTTLVLRSIQEKARAEN
jgi:hypothetical protein